MLPFVPAQLPPSMSEKEAVREAVLSLYRCGVLLSLASPSQEIEF
jgi:hypothetical protein